MPRQFSDEQIIQIIKEQAKKLGHAPKKDWWQEQGLKPGKTTIQNYFGSWNKALRAAGLEPNIESRVTRQMLIDDIKRVADELGKPPKITDYHCLGKYTNIQSHGGWKSLILEAGLRSYHRISRKELIQAIRDVTKDLGRTPLYTEFTKHRLGYSSTIVYKHFDGYDDMLAEIGLELPERVGGWRDLPDEKLFEEAKQISLDLGHTPSALEYTALSTTHCNTIRYKFGTYSKFLKLAGLRPNQHFETNDGHITHSRFELEIDNYLHEHGIAHSIQVRVCKERYWTCDFVVGNLWIEADGYNGKRYGPAAGRWREKLQFYKDNSYDFIVITPDSWKETLRQIVEIIRWLQQKTGRPTSYGKS